MATHLVYVLCLGVLGVLKNGTTLVWQIFDLHGEKREKCDNKFKNVRNDILTSVGSTFSFLVLSTRNSNNNKIYIITPPVPVWTILTKEEGLRETMIPEARKCLLTHLRSVNTYTLAMEETS